MASICEVTAPVAKETELVRVRRSVVGPPRSRRPTLDLVPLAFFAAHIPLGIAMKQSPGLATAHGMLTIAVVFAAALALQRPAPIIVGTAYIAVADVFWRMTEASVPWEISKHSLTALSIIILFRFAKRLPEAHSLWYIALLLPAALITLIDKGADAVDPISFNLGGPVALAMGAAMFSVVRLEVHDFRRLTYIAVAPIMGVWIIALQALLRTETFSTNSSKEAVGGFGPNQVSTVLGFGALLCLMWALREPSRLHRIVMLATGLALLIQSSLTFSRGGLFNTLAALVAVAFLYIKRPSRIVLGAVVLAGLLFALSPLLAGIDSYTDGNLSQRFSETGTTGRDEIAAADLELFRQAPILGVGVGQSKELRDSTHFQGAAAHTEFTRLLAEHGLLGALAIATLALLAMKILSRRTELWEQAWALSLMVWTAAAMSNAAMRTGAGSLAFALAAARLASPGQTQTASGKNDDGAAAKGEAPAPQPASI